VRVQVRQALQVHEALVALSPWSVVRLSAEEWTADVAHGRRMHVSLSPVGAVTTAYLQVCLEGGGC